MMSSLIDLTGKQISKWTVLKRGPNNASNHTRYWCQCQCGTKKLIASNSLRSGDSTQCKSCGKSQGYEEISGSYWGEILRGAKKRQIKINITIRQAWSLFLEQDRKCALSSIELTFAKSRKFNKTQTASLDRIDSSKGYTLDNVQWIYRDINKMKMDIDQDHFISLCKMISDHFTLKQGIYFHA